MHGEHGTFPTYSLSFTSRSLRIPISTRIFSDLSTHGGALAPDVEAAASMSLAPGPRAAPRSRSVALVHKKGQNRTFSVHPGCQGAPGHPTQGVQPAEASLVLVPRGPDAHGSPGVIPLLEERLCVVPGAANRHVLLGYSSHGRASDFRTKAFYIYLKSF